MSDSVRERGRRRGIKRDKQVRREIFKGMLEQENMRRKTREKREEEIVFRDGRTRGGRDRRTRWRGRK